MFIHVSKGTRYGYCNHYDLKYLHNGYALYLTMMSTLISKAVITYQLIMIFTAYKYKKK